MKKGDKVTTIHGEKLKVLDVKVLPSHKKKGVVVNKPITMVLAKSGDHNVWFPEANIKGTK